MNSILVEKIKNPNVSLIDLEQLKTKTIYIAIFGVGNVGGRLIDQIHASYREILERRDLDLKIFAIANSSHLLLDKEGCSENWRDAIIAQKVGYTLQDVLTYAQENEFDNLIAIDNTADVEFVLNYEPLVKSGFSLVSSNKIGNTIGLDFYRNLRKTLSKHKKEYLYETNVGAGLPLVDTIKLLHLSGENITRIKGVFSGSLSYLFNRFSEGNKLFSEVLQDAINKGYTEPDAREDLCGNDVGRKLLILARELELHNEFSDIQIENLIPKQLRQGTKEDFLLQLKDFDVPFHLKKKNQKKGHVLRYIGDLRGDLSKNDGAILEVKLVSVPRNSMLGQLKGSDSIFEIYSESYGDNPIVIQGAGAGAEVTARGVFGDVLRLSNKLN
ncbi:aspartate kinase [Cochleicola gelatinilyticus]|uniref:homoserine dehydrogenase n=1 Tax=Cochleicola gelatinilyticus TaxID=1763537 RepID=A0A167EZ49_9FLAO|nr:aspartate kinase [Cochleicola gelatinilyticus]